NEIVEPMLTAPFHVRSNRRETGDTRTLELTATAGGYVPVWSPRQLMIVYVFGAGEIPISISGNPAQCDRIIHTVRAVGPVSHAICKAREGAAIGLRRH